MTDGEMIHSMLGRLDGKMDILVANSATHETRILALESDSAARTAHDDRITELEDRADENDVAMATMNGARKSMSRVGKILWGALVAIAAVAGYGMDHFGPHVHEVSKTISAKS